MSQNRMSAVTRKRIPRILEGLLKNETHEEIAEAVGVKNRKTIERDLQAWRDSGGLETFLHDEWLRMHGKIKEMEPLEAYRQLTKLLSKTLTQRVQTELKQTGPIVIKMWTPKEDADSKSK